MCAVTHFYNVQYFYVFSKSKVLIIIIINMVNIIVTYELWVVTSVDINEDTWTVIIRDHHWEGDQYYCRTWFCCVYCLMMHWIPSVTNFWPMNNSNIAAPVVVHVLIMGVDWIWWKTLLRQTFLYQYSSRHGTLPQYRNGSWYAVWRQSVQQQCGQLHPFSKCLWLRNNDFDISCSFKFLCSLTRSWCRSRS